MVYQPTQIVPPVQPQRNWGFNIIKSLDFSGIQGAHDRVREKIFKWHLKFFGDNAIYAHDHLINGAHHRVPEKRFKWHPKFFGDNAISAHDHLVNFFELMNDNQSNEHEDMVMKLFANSLEGDVKTCFINLEDNSLKDWPTFERDFLDELEVKIDSKFFMNQLHEIKKKENELVQEFNTRSQKVVEKNLVDIKPTANTIFLFYVNYYQGQFGFMLQDKAPSTLPEA